MHLQASSSLGPRAHARRASRSPAVPGFATRLPTRAAARRGDLTAPRATEDLPSDAEVVTPLALPPSSSSYAGLRLLVVGGAGGVGRAVCAAAAAEGIPVTALVRDPARARAVLPSAVSIVTGDVSRFASLSAALAAAGDFNAVVWAVGSNSLSTFSKDVKEGGPVGLLRAVATAANPLAARGVELSGVENLLAALRQREGGEKGLKSIILVSSIGADDPLAQAAFPGLVLLWKKRAEEALQRSGLPHTVVRPGGLKNADGARGGGGGASTSAVRLGSAGLVMTGPGGIKFGGGRPMSISRAQVADVCLAALVTEEAKGKVVEVVAEKKDDGARAPWADLFGAAEQ